MVLNTHTLYMCVVLLPFSPTLKGQHHIYTLNSTDLNQHNNNIIVDSFLHAYQSQNRVHT